MTDKEKSKAGPIMITGIPGHFVENVVILPSAAAVRSALIGMDKNRITGNHIEQLGGAMLKKQQQTGVDIHSLAVDPMFVDPANGDFRLRPNSPALGLGFVPLDMSKVGLVGDADRSELRQRSDPKK